MNPRPSGCKMHNNSYTSKYVHIYSRLEVYELDCLDKYLQFLRHRKIEYWGWGQIGVNNLALSFIRSIHLLQRPQ